MKQSFFGDDFQDMSFLSKNMYTDIDLQQREDILFGLSFHSNIYNPTHDQLSHSSNTSEDSKELKQIKSSPIVHQKSKQEAINLIKEKENEHQTNKGNKYEKNICSYTMNVCHDNFIGGVYIKKIRKLCEQFKCDYSYVMKYYRSQSGKGLGIRRLTGLITPSDSSQIGLKSVFAKFLDWFLRQRYMIYLLRFGKMSDKKKYIEFKDKYILYANNREETIELIENLATMC